MQKNRAHKHLGGENVIGTRALVKGLLVDLVVFLLFFTTFAFIYQSTYGDIPMLYLLLAIPFFLMSVMRLAITKDKILFFILHIVLVAAAPLLPFDYTLRLSFAAFMLASAVYSIATKFKSSWSLNYKTAMFVLIFKLSVFALLNVFHNDGTTIFIFLNISTLLIFVIIITYIHIENLDFNLLMHKSLHRRHDDRVITANNKLAIIFAAILAGVGTISIFAPLGTIISTVFARVYSVVAWGLLIVFNGVLSVIAFFLPYIGEVTVTPIDGDPLAGDYSSWDEIVTGQRRIFEMVVALIIIAFFIFLYKKFILGFIASKKHKSFISADTTVSKVKRISKGFVRLIPRLRGLIKHPLRRTYIRKVRSHIKHGVAIMPYDTPDKIANKIYHREDIGDLTDKYEEVRYGKD